MGASTDPTTIGELLNDVQFTRSNDDLTIQTRAAIDQNGQRVAGDTTITDYFKTQGQGIAGERWS